MMEGKKMVVTASLGVAIYPDDASDGARLLRVADQRMYLLSRSRRCKQRVRPEMMPVSGRLSTDATA